MRHSNENLLMSRGLASDAGYASGRRSVLQELLNVAESANGDANKLMEALQRKAVAAGIVEANS